MKYHISAIGFMLSTLLSCTEQKVNLKEEGEKLMQISREWSRSVGQDSIEKVMSYWAEDAVYMPPGQTSLVGKEAIRQMVKKSLNIPGFQIKWEPQTVTMAKSGDMAYLIEKSEITARDSLGNPRTEYYKGLTVWRKENGTWKNIVEMVNADPNIK